MTDKIVIFVTVGNSKDAALLAKSLVEKRLAACVNLLPGVASWYWWEGKVTEDQEVLLMMKTSRDKFADARERSHPRRNSCAANAEVIALYDRGGLEELL